MGAFTTAAMHHAVSRPHSRLSIRTQRQSHESEQARTPGSDRTLDATPAASYSPWERSHACRSERSLSCSTRDPFTRHPHASEVIVTDARRRPVFTARSWRPRDRSRGRLTSGITTAAPLAALAGVPQTAPAATARQVERLDRGLTGVHNGSGNLVPWRWLATPLRRLHTLNEPHPDGGWRTRRPAPAPTTPRSPAPQHCSGRTRP